MGAGAPERQGPDRPIVAFDFDGTLTVRDSFTAFLVWRTPPLRLLLRSLRMIPATLRYLADRDRGRMKAVVAHVFLKDVDAAELAAEAERFAELAAARLLRPDAIAAWEAHRREGALLVIVSASPETVVAPFARRLGADRLIATRLEVDERGRVTGRLTGANCRGEEKARRLRETYGPGVRLAAAYGDTSGDREMLAMAERPGMRVFKARP